MRKRTRWMAAVCALVCACSMSPVEGTRAADNAVQQTKTDISVPVVDNVNFSSDRYGKASGLLSEPGASEMVTLQVTEPVALNVLVYAYTASTAAVQSTTFSVSGEDGSSLTTAQISTKNTTPAQITQYSQLACNQQVPAGKYTVKIQGNSLTSPVAYQILAIGYRNTKEEEISLGNSISGYGANEEAIYKKITVPNDGCLQVKASQFPATEYWKGNAVKRAGSMLTLCNEQKQPLGTQVTTLQDEDYIHEFFVKKGTYYLKLTGADCYYFLSAGIVHKDVLCKKKTKAISVSEEEGAILPLDGTKSCGWYKITIKKARKMTASIGFSGNGKIKAILYRGNVKKAKSQYFGGNTSYVCTMKNARTGKKIKWQKGTYYIKVMRNSVDTNGEVTVSID